VLWYVNLVHFTGAVHPADDLVAWTEARQQVRVTDVRVTEMQTVNGTSIARVATTSGRAKQVPGWVSPSIPAGSDPSGVSR
jgi:hypothetical protein